MAGEGEGQAGAAPEGGSAVSDPGPGDESFSFPQDFESVGDEPLDAGGEAAPEGSADGSPPVPQPQQGQQAGAPAKAGAEPAPKQTTQPAAQPTQTQQQPRTGEARPAPPQRLGTPQLIERLTANRDSILSELSSSRFKIGLSKAETEALESDAVAAIPQILSRVASTVYYEAALASLSQIQNLVPHLTQTLMEANTQHSAAERAFFAAWPNISPANEEHVKAVQDFANFYRGRNPSATQAEAVAAVGKAVSAFLGLPVQSQRGGGGPQRGGAPRTGSRPFAPAGGAGTAQRAPGNGAAPDPFHGMGMDFDE